MPHDFSPLRQSKHLSKLISILHAELWASKGVYYFHYLFTTGCPKPFDLLEEEFPFPNNMLFHYLQLKHALRAQLPSTCVPPFNRRNMWQ